MRRNKKLLKRRSNASDSVAMTMLHFLLSLLLSLVIVSASFQNGRSSYIFQRRPPSLRSGTLAVLCEQLDTAVAAAVFPTACEDDAVTNLFKDSEKTHVPAVGSNYLNNSNKFHLLSLQWTPDDDPTRFSKTVTNVWRWKDAALGDGRDYFVPRPKTLRALQSYLLAQIAAATAAATTFASSSSFHVKECVILSNCARFEILLELKNCNKDYSIDDEGNEENDIHDVLTEIISSALLCQVESFQRKPRFSLLLLPVDWPGVIDMNANNKTATLTSALSNENATAFAAAIKELSQHWTHYTNLESIMQHLSHVAAGLATRPRRPDRVVVFRPFSSRDAHILLQMKRTVDLFGRASITKNNDKNLESSSSSSYLPKLLRFCLQAGKAARNPTVVPELEELRVYGTGDDSRYSSEVPSEVQNRVVEAVLTKAIVPTINKCTADFRAQQSAEQIQMLRTSVEQMAETTQELTWLRRYLHEPTLRLRRGERVDTSALVQELSIALKASRGSVVATT